ncbi:hypothetical protein GBAR_LOCUS12791 [Geodia barretti]|uniref:Uncharacterized protein n=1 Tax=Geodia barretti TaxID=519541 RepID=A0AA35S192_GEOBA|nr:hypothetical protein GBAR_LOCUS12791 [Geodia barretti]
MSSRDGYRPRHRGRTGPYRNRPRHRDRTSPYHNRPQQQGASRYHHTRFQRRTNLFCNSSKAGYKAARRRSSYSEV